MARYSPFRSGRFSRYYNRSPQNRSSAGQGRMKADFSGNQELIRHTVTNTIVSPYTLADGKAIAVPLLVFTGDSNNTSPNPATESQQATYADGSRVNHIQAQMTITQEDATKPNNCYIGFISTSFSDAMLDSANMLEQFAGLIGLDSGNNSNITTNGEFYDGLLPNISARDLTINDYLSSSRKRHWIRGLARNKYTLYSGRPLVMNQVFRVPSKNKRGQFGSGYWMVILNESGSIQGVEAGSATDINVSITSFFKEIPIVSPPVTP